MRIRFGLCVVLVGAIASVWAMKVGRCEMAVAAVDSAAKQTPSIEDYATIEAYVGEERIPVYAFGYTFIYGVSPDLLPGVVMQAGDTNPVEKIKPKKSWEIESNLLGSTPAREPKTMWNDDQPLLPIHLIDGDPETAWSSRANFWPDKQPAWIRVDLPVEATVSSVALVCSEVGPSPGVGLLPPCVGNALPKDLTIKISRDTRHWETVFESKDFSGPDSGPSVINFSPRQAKQIWIIGNNPSVRNFLGYSFSIGEVEVRDPAGTNLALVSRGAGVQVSSTNYGLGMDRFTQDMLWPVQYDLGFKWSRIGYALSQFMWSYVEREKGKLCIDPKADQAVTDAVNNGINVMLCLDTIGHWLYEDPPRKINWKVARTRENMDAIFEVVGYPTDSKEREQGFLRYVDYMARHFKGRIAYYEIGNEWNSTTYWWSITDFLELTEKAIATIKKADPDAKILFGSVSNTGWMEDRFSGYITINCLGPGCRVSDGQLHVNGRALLTAAGVKEKDVNISVDAQTESPVGFVLRFNEINPIKHVIGMSQRRCDLVHAIYDPVAKLIYFEEFAAPHYEYLFRSYVFHTFMSATPAEGLGPKVHLSAEVNGDTVALTVSDGKKSVTGRHTITKMLEPGGVGLIHCPQRPGSLCLDASFDNFVVTDLEGRTIFKDEFDGSARRAAGWDLLLNHWDTLQTPLVEQVDAVGIHPVVPGPELSAHFEAVRLFKQDCGVQGFRGTYSATECYWPMPYPILEGNITEMQKAKYGAQEAAGHCGLDMISLYNETFSTYSDQECTLFRNGFPVDPINPIQPQPLYYVFRTMCTAFDGFRPADFRVTFTGEGKLDHFTFRRGESESMVAVWIPGEASNGIVEAETDIRVVGVQARKAWVIDVLNGTQQELLTITDGGDTLIKRMLVKDYPVLIRIAS